MTAMMTDFSLRMLIMLVSIFNFLTSRNQQSTKYYFPTSHNMHGMQPAAVGSLGQNGPHVWPNPGWPLCLASASLLILVLHYWCQEMERHEAKQDAKLLNITQTHWVQTLCRRLLSPADNRAGGGLFTSLMRQGRAGVRANRFSKTHHRQQPINLYQNKSY